MAQTFGKIKEYDLYSSESKWDEYVERLRLYFVANDVTDNDKQRAILLTCCGSKLYSLIRNLCSPGSPNDKTLDELCTLIGTHFNPKPIIIAERYRFYQMVQGENESVSQCLAALRKLTEPCQFDAF